MAYNNFPVGYQPAQFYYPQQQNYMQNMQSQVQQQNSGFIRVQSENEARLYPVAPGNSVIFIDENAPYCYTKTVDTSQLDRPKFEKYRLIKEEPQQEMQQVGVQYASKEEIEVLKEEIEALKKLLPTEKKSVRVAPDKST